MVVTAAALPGSDLGVALPRFARNTLVVALTRGGK